MIQEKKAQSAVLGLLTLMALVLMVSSLVDIYRLFAARNWAYAVAQEAAWIGAAEGRDWVALTLSGEIRLEERVAKDTAEAIVLAELKARDIEAYALEIRVLPEPDGGISPGFPPRPVRLGESLGEWQSTEPAVGVYLSLPVDWLLLDHLGIIEKSVSVFASAGVAR